MHSNFIKNIETPCGTEKFCNLLSEALLENNLSLFLVNYLYEDKSVFDSYFDRIIRHYIKVDEKYLNMDVTTPEYEAHFNECMLKIYGNVPSICKVKVNGIEFEYFQSPKTWDKYFSYRFFIKYRELNKNFSTKDEIIKIVTRMSKIQNWHDNCFKKELINE